MNTPRNRYRVAALGVLAFAAASIVGESTAQAQLFRGRAQGGQYRVRVVERGYYGSPYVAPVYTPPTYVQSAPVTYSQTSVYQPAPVVQERVYQPAPVVQREVYQPAPYVESRVVRPAPVVVNRVIQSPPVVQREVYQPAPVIQQQTYSSSYPY